MRNAGQFCITFYTRPGCCLCDNALEVLARLQKEFSLNIEIVDISGIPELEARYGALVPVGTRGGEEIFRYHADEESLRQLMVSYRENDEDLHARR
jgi:hypothetical protein